MAIGEISNTRVAIYKNGALYKEQNMYEPAFGVGTVGQTPTVTFIADANGSTDYFEVYVYQFDNGGVSRTIGASGVWTFFSGARIG